jgi:hypothetical protein
MSEAPSTRLQSHVRNSERHSFPVRWLGYDAHILAIVECIHTALKVVLSVRLQDICAWQQQTTSSTFAQHAASFAPCCGAKQIYAHTCRYWFSYAVLFGLCSDIIRHAVLCCS